MTIASSYQIFISHFFLFSLGFGQSFLLFPFMVMIYIPKYMYTLLLILNGGISIWSYHLLKIVAGFRGELRMLSSVFRIPALGVKKIIQSSQAFFVV